MSSKTRRPLTLAIDVGGSSIKALLLAAGTHAMAEAEPIQVKTPRPATPQALLAAIFDIGQRLPGFDRVGVGFPGRVLDGVVFGAVNLDPLCEAFPFRKRIEEHLGKPVRMANDADLQGLGAISGKGVELVLTLGTGIGSALFSQGRLLPNMELGHLPFRNNKSFEDELGDAALARIGEDNWREVLLIDLLASTIAYDSLLLGGGNARLLDKTKGFALPAKVSCIHNRCALLGGLALWEQEGVC